MPPQLRTFLRGDVDWWADAWTASLGDQFPLSSRVLALSIFGDPDFQEGDAVIAEESREPCGFGSIKRVRSTIPAGPEGFLATLFVRPSWRGRGVGTLILTALEARLTQEGCALIRVSGGMHRLMPGVPTEPGEPVGFLQGRGYRHREWRYDLACDISGFVPRGAPPPTAKIAEASDGQALLSFLEAEFAGPWARYARWSLDNGAKLRDTIVLEIAGRIGGFCRVHRPGASLPGPSTYWEAQTGSGACGIGPIGVSPRFRDQGLGSDLLEAAILLLRKSGGRTCVVDSTEALAFYERFGFKVIRSYERLEKTIASG